MNLGLLVLRLVGGLLFVGHGAQKLFGIWGGHGLAGTAGFFEGIGLKPGRLHATAAGVFEFAGGALLALGLLTPFAAAVLIATMTAAIISVHFSKGIWVTDGGYEYNLVLASAAFALAATGPGNWSLDHALSLSDHGRGVGDRRAHRRRRRWCRRDHQWPCSGPSEPDRREDAPPDHRVERPNRIATDGGGGSPRSSPPAIL